MNIFFRSIRKLKLKKDKARVGKDEYDNPGEAGARAKEIGCTGVHSHDTPSGKVFMPCKTHDEYMNQFGLCYCIIALCTDVINSPRYVYLNICCSRLYIFVYPVCGAAASA